MSQLNRFSEISVYVPKLAMSGGRLIITTRLVETCPAEVAEEFGYSPYDRSLRYMRDVGGVKRAVYDRLTYRALEPPE